jgi:tRNA(fMet)-specific endonuclease VapC
MKALLDTDTLSDLLRATSAEVVARAEEYRKKEGVLTISTITVVEVVHGWSRTGSPKRARLFRRWIRHAKVLPLEREIAWLAGEIGGALTRTGQPIGFADGAIAATALHV